MRRTEIIVKDIEKAPFCRFTPKIPLMAEFEPHWSGNLDSLQVSHRWVGLHSEPSPKVCFSRTLELSTARTQSQTLLRIAGLPDGSLLVESNTCPHVVLFRTTWRILTASGNEVWQLQRRELGTRTLGKRRWESFWFGMLDQLIKSTSRHVN